MNKQGIIPIIAIIAGLLAIGGIAGVYTYVMNNQSTLEPAVEEARAERAADAQQNGYPDLWAEAGLPEYPNGTLTKIREGRHLADGVQVTFETTDPMATIKSFWDAELGALGLTEANTLPGNDYALLTRYTNGNKSLSLQITRIGESAEYKVYMQYHE